MWLITGLGNPGDDYTNTRHNIGFMVIEALAERHSISVTRKTSTYLYGRGFIEGTEAILIKPLTFMNRSGTALRDACIKHEEVDNIIVVHDDLDLEPGTIRIKKNGSSGGHRGIDSIINVLGTRDFVRIRIGIGRSVRLSPEVYVLRPFSKREQSLIDETIVRAADALCAVLSKGVSYAQNHFHSSALKQQ